MFIFTGLFADPAEGLPEQFARLWPGLDIIRIDRPIVAIAARFDPHLDDEAMDRAVPLVEALSARHPAGRFLLLHTECFGGDCGYRGQILQDGRTVLEADGDGAALRRLIGYWGIDLGPQARFEPLRRDFPWRQETPPG
ncbi:hypothetical protein [Nitrospirillum viridazoti]|uniref:Uncharacterized protein n=1 Tax=Nitrospirillum viridazoti CBAmc TaxID=1441467 RepID=A0A248JY13_9PROT|nr:hypothetical protein [Nitrospirillum amazonense]ASG23028.1 hypothetical protein Y958_19355 [Nitrospirillum amazonense CBAmc]TWB38747.1 hypothetical protein FBZ91_10675 [Nitrospirillum amazonense]